jgi:hypothetical protein
MFIGNGGSLILNSTLLKSTEIGQQDDIASDFATGEQQLFSIGGPVEVEDSTRSEFGLLAGRSA